MLISMLKANRTTEKGEHKKASEHTSCKGISLKTSAMI
jgi:hypothetical protein